MSQSPGFIPFITGKEVCNQITDYYADAPIARVGLWQLAKLKTCLPKVPLWIDAGVDGLDDLKRGTPAPANPDDPRKPWHDTIKSFAAFDQVADPVFQAAPNKSVVETFVFAALNACLLHGPAAVSVPQLPHVNDSSRNKINRALAEASAKWQIKHPKISLVLPVILNHGSQSENKTVRNAHVKLGAQCLAASKAQACWIVDASFSDEDQSAQKRRERIAGLVGFHLEFNAATSAHQCVRIGGPYWGLNILLWCRGLIDQFGIGVGTGYCYYLSGGFPSAGTAKVAIGPLYRRAKVGPKLRDWFTTTLKSTSASHPIYTTLYPLRNIGTMVPSDAKRQTAEFYRSWINYLAAVPPAGRPMTLFQSLSIAFSYGKLIQADLDDEAATRRPESVAEALMLNCL